MAQALLPLFALSLHLLLRPACASLWGQSFYGITPWGWALPAPLHSQQLAEGGALVHTQQLGEGAASAAPGAPVHTQQLAEGSASAAPGAPVHARQLGEGGAPASASDSSFAWRPQEGKYLLALCLSGGQSEQLRCLKKSYQVAGLLNRTLLVLPKAVMFVSEQQLPTWDWTTFVNFDRMRKCLKDDTGGENAVLTVPEYLSKAKKAKVSVATIRCVVPGSPSITNCYHTKGANALVEASQNQLELPKASMESVVMSPLAEGKPVSPRDVASAFGALQDEVVCLGDLSPLSLQPPPGGVLAKVSFSEACVNIWRPHPAVMSFVDGILDTLLGSQYAAVHWRTGMNKQQHEKGEVLTAKEVASSVRAKLKDTDVSVVYVATDARKAELSAFEALLKDAGEGKRFAAMLTLRAILVDEEWLLKQFWSKDAILMEKERKNGVAYALIDKFVCARAKFFLGTAGSKFTRDILDIREAEGLKNPDGMDSTF